MYKLRLSFNQLDSYIRVTVLMPVNMQISYIIMIVILNMQLM